MRVLLVEDEVALAAALARGLRRNAIAVDVVHDGANALRRSAERDYDVVVLDRDLPLVHGDEVCRRLLERGRASRILMLTAASGLGDVVGGLNLGADDYVVKPVALMELLARLRALARRPGPAAPAQLEWRDLRVEVESGRVWRGQTPILLTRRELILLEELLRGAGAPLSAERLLARVFDDPRAEPTAASVRVLVLRLRRKLGAPPLIATAPGRGYRLV